MTDRRRWGLLPFLLGTVLIAVVVLVTTLRGRDETRSAAPPAPRAPAVSAGVKAAHRSPTPAPEPTTLEPTPPEVSDRGPDRIELPVGEGPRRAEPPPPGPAKPPLTVDEKLALVARHLVVMEKHAAALEQQIADAKRAGGVAPAEKQVQLVRLRKRMSELQRDIDEHRDPQGIDE